jgi:hypothetical protein
VGEVKKEKQEKWYRETRAGWRGADYSRVPSNRNQSLRIRKFPAKRLKLVLDGAGLKGPAW